MRAKEPREHSEIKEMVGQRWPICKAWSVHKAVLYAEYSNLCII